MLISVVIPLRDEESSLLQLFDELSSAFSEVSFDREFILVSDGSRDRTPVILQEKSRDWPVLRPLILSKSGGQTSALRHGIAAARGEWIGTLDGALQDDPRDLRRMLELTAPGFEAIIGYRRQRAARDSILKSFCSWAANASVSLLFFRRQKDLGCPVRLMRASLAKRLLLRDGMHRFIPILCMLEGAAIRQIAVAHRGRKHGSSHYGISRVFKVLPDILRLWVLRVKQREKWSRSSITRDGT